MFFERPPNVIEVIILYRLPNLGFIVSYFVHANNMFMWTNDYINMIIKIFIFQDDTKLHLHTVFTFFQYKPSYSTGSVHSVSVPFGASFCNIKKSTCTFIWINIYFQSLYMHIILINYEMWNNGRVNRNLTEVCKLL